MLARNDHRTREFRSPTQKVLLGDGSLDRCTCICTRPDKKEVFQTAADPNGSRGLNLSATSPYLSDIFVTAPHHTIETDR